MTDIPVPPFATAAAADRFHELLLLRLRSLGEKQPETLQEFVLSLTLQPHRAFKPLIPLRQLQAPPPEVAPAVCAQCQVQYPCETVLIASAALRFPAPWTPTQLALSFAAAGMKEWAGCLTVSDSGFSWGTDPSVIAGRESSGQWTVRTSERGNVRVEAQLNTDREMCGYLQDWVVTMAPAYPRVSAPGDMDLATLGLDEVRKRWHEHSTVPLMAYREPPPTA